MSAKGDETTVIVVDDDRATRTLILEILKNEPYRVEVFSSQEAAAEFHRKSGCSAVIYAVSILDESVPPDRFDRAGDHTGFPRLFGAQ